MMWTIIFIIFAISLVVGPIMLMQPSVRDRRLANLRQSAAENGLHVRLVRYREQPVAVYCKSFASLNKSLDWQLIREKYEHDIHFFKEWRFQNDSAVFMEPHKLEVQSFLEKLPKDIVGVEIKQQVLGFWWIEQSKDISVARLNQWFDELANILNN